MQRLAIYIYDNDEFDSYSEWFYFEYSSKEDFLADLFIKVKLSLRAYTDRISIMEKYKPVLQNYEEYIKAMKEHDNKYPKHDIIRLFEMDFSAARHFTNNETRKIIIENPDMIDTLNINDIDIGFLGTFDELFEREGVSQDKVFTDNNKQY